MEDTTLSAYFSIINRKMFIISQHFGITLASSNLIYTNSWNPFLTLLNPLHDFVLGRKPGRVYITTECIRYIETL